MSMADCMRCGTRITSNKTDDSWAHLEDGYDGHEARPKPPSPRKQPGREEGELPAPRLL